MAEQGFGMTVKGQTLLRTARYRKLWRKMIVQILKISYHKEEEDRRKSIIISHKNSEIFKLMKEKRFSVTFLKMERDIFIKYFNYLDSVVTSNTEI